MIFTPTKLSGAFLIDLKRHQDERGFFARAWCRDEMAGQGLDSHLVQCNLSFNHQRGTLRGMHFQASPHEEIKLVRCTRGAIYDVIVDLRPDSSSYCQWSAFELSEDNRRALYVPGGFAHGFQTLAANTEVFYQMSQAYHPESARGVRWNDPAFAIDWPILPPVQISARDANYPDFRP